MTTTTAYRIDHDTDSDRASDGISRYSAYVRQNAGKFSWAFEERDAVEFAAVAFEIASSPIMSPGYVLDHPRILATRLSSYEEHLLVQVDLVAPSPAPLAYPAWREAARWYGWPRESETFGGYYYRPESDDLLKRPYLLTTTSLQTAIEVADLPACPAGPHDEIELAALAAVEALLPALNTLLAPALTALEKER